MTWPQAFVIVSLALIVSALFLGTYWIASRRPPRDLPYDPLPDLLRHIGPRVAEINSQRPDKPKLWTEKRTVPQDKDGDQ